MYVRMAITMVIAFFTTRVTLEQLGVDDFGLNNLVGSIVSMFSFLNGSMGTAVQRFFSIEIGKGNDARIKKIYGVGLFLHILVAIISIVGAEFFALFFLEKLNIPENRMFAAHIVFQISIMSFALNIVNVPNAALLRAREWFSKTAMVEIVQAFLRLGVLFLLVYFGKDKLITFSILNLFVTLYYVSSILFLARKFSETHTRPIIDKVLIREMLTFISLLIFTVLAQLLKTQGLIVLINLFFGLAINAAYAVAVQVSNLLNTFVQNFKSAMVPQMMAAYGADDKKSMHSLITSGTKIAFLMMLVLSMPLLIDGDWLLSIWLREVPLYSKELVALTVIFINVSSFAYFLYQGVHATGKIKGQQICMSSLYFANIGIIYVVLKLGGSFYSALYVNILISVIQCMVNIYYAKKTFGFDALKFVLKTCLPCLLVFVVIFGSLYCFSSMFETSIKRVLLDVCVEIVLTGILGYFVIMNKDERKMSKNFMVKKLRSKSAEKIKSLLPFKKTFFFIAIR